MRRKVRQQPAKNTSQDQGQVGRDGGAVPEQPFDAFADVLPVGCDAGERLIVAGQRRGIWEGGGERCSVANVQVAAAVSQCRIHDSLGTEGATGASPTLTSESSSIICSFFSLILPSAASTLATPAEALNDALERGAAASKKCNYLHSLPTYPSGRGVFAHHRSSDSFQISSVQSEMVLRASLKEPCCQFRGLLSCRTSPFLWMRPMLSAQVRPSFSAFHLAHAQILDAAMARSSLAPLIVPCVGWHMAICNAFHVATQLAIYLVYA